MTRTYPPEQTAAVDSAEARHILANTGLPDGVVGGFRPADQLRPLEGLPDLLVIGTWFQTIPVCLGLSDAAVVSVAPWGTGIDLVNSSLQAFLDSQQAIRAAAPLSKAAYGSWDGAGEHVRTLLTGIDPTVMADPDSTWADILDDIKNGDYAEVCQEGSGGG